MLEITFQLFLVNWQIYARFTSACCFIMVYLQNSFKYYVSIYMDKERNMINTGIYFKGTQVFVLKTVKKCEKFELREKNVGWCAEPPIILQAGSGGGGGSRLALRFELKPVLGAGALTRISSLSDWEHAGHTGLCKMKIYAR